MNVEKIKTWAAGIRENCARASWYFLPADREEINFMLDQIMDEIASEGSNGVDVSGLAKTVADFRAAVITADEVVKGGSGSPFFESLSNFFRELSRMQLIESGFKFDDKTWVRERTFSGKSVMTLPRPTNFESGYDITELRIP